jgi:hypothetical protein
MKKAPLGSVTPLTMKWDAVLGHRVPESVVGAASATLSDHEWCQSPGRSDGK